jgi:hypothetical protein
MADTKISALPASTTPLAGTEVLPIVQSGATKQVSVADLTAGRAISATAVTASTGNFIVGTAGQGIDFSATPGAPGATSELLDDYEIGTWTPTDASGAGLTLSVASANYTKIGNTVRLQAQITYPSNVSGASVLLGGLPFSSAQYAIGAIRTSVACVATALGANIYVHSPVNVAITNVELTGAFFAFTVVYNV